jgi:hypothetical protein
VTCEYCHQPATHIHVTGCYQNHIRDYRVCEPHNQITLKTHNESPQQLIHCPQCGGPVPGEMQSEPIRRIDALNNLISQTASQFADLNRETLTITDSIQQLNQMLPKDEQEIN